MFLWPYDYVTAVWLYYCDIILNLTLVPKIENKLKRKYKENEKILEKTWVQAL